MLAETRDIFLHGQLKESLLYEIMRALAVLGTQNYKDLCLATQNEEGRLAALHREGSMRTGDPSRQVAVHVQAQDGLELKGEVM